MGIACTTRIATTLVALLATGISINAAAAQMGLGDDLVHSWLDRGRRAKRGKLRELALAADAARDAVRARVANGGPLVTAADR